MKIGKFEDVPIGNPSLKVPIDILREYVANFWLDYKRTQSEKIFGKASSLTSPSQDSFANWIQELPEGHLRQLDRERFHATEEILEGTAAWIEALRGARHVVFMLAFNISGEAEYQALKLAPHEVNLDDPHKVTIDELTASPLYYGLKPAEQFAARTIVEKYQRQNADGLWVLDNERRYHPVEKS